MKKKKSELKLAASISRVVCRNQSQQSRFNTAHNSKLNDALEPFLIALRVEFKINKIIYFYFNVLKWSCLKNEWLCKWGSGLKAVWRKREKMG